MTIEELSKLSDEELRVRCAELCGWEMTNGDRVAQGTWKNITGEMLPDESYAPNYPADLNAMHEAWLTLKTDEEQAAHGRALWDQVEDEPMYFDEGGIDCGMLARIANASARQRCIAFIAVMQSA